MFVAIRRPVARAALLLFCLADLSGCDSDDADERDHIETLASPAPTVSEVWVDAANGPRNGEPFIAGEPLLLGLRIRGGTAPYHVQFSVIDDVAPSTGRHALDASIDVAPEEATAAGVEVGAQASLGAEALSGTYRLHVLITDDDGHEVRARSNAFTVVGNDASQLPAPESATFIEVRDAAQRRRLRFVRGERVAIQAQLRQPSGDRVTLTIRSPGGRAVAKRPDLPVTGDSVHLPFDVPRLAPPGRYRLEVRDSEQVVAEGELVIDGTRLPRRRQLRVERVDLYGGAKLRAPRSGLIARGEALLVEARVAAAAGSSTVIRLRDASGREVVKKELPRPSIHRRHRDVRAYVGGEFAVPSNARPGSYVLEVESRRGKHVSTLYRHLTVR